jgi:ATP-dependent Clp protease ATP-binding subunit ClpA
LKDYFRPEFLNRIDEVVLFDILSQDSIKKIVDIRIEVVRERLLEKGIMLHINDDALSYLAKEGYNPHYGARPLNRLIQTKILNPVASHIISNNAGKGDTVYVSVKDNELVIDTKKKPRGTMKMKPKVMA